MMSQINPRLFRMMEAHRRVDDELRREQARAAADWQRVQTLKKLKLRIKDVLHRLLVRRPRVAPVVFGR